MGVTDNFEHSQVGRRSIIVVNVVRFGWIVQNYLVLVTKPNNPMEYLGPDFKFVLACLAVPAQN